MLSAQSLAYAICPAIVSKIANIVNKVKKGINFIESIILL
jgi:hypothetical protein